MTDPISSLAGGDTTISSQSDADGIASCTKLKGDITISKSYTGSLSLARIEEVTGRAAEDITESSQFREDLAVDSLDAVEIAAAMEDEFPTRVSAGQLASLHTVSDAIDLLLGHIPATRAAEFDPMSPTTSTASSSRRKKQAL